MSFFGLVGCNRLSLSRAFLDSVLLYYSDTGACLCVCATDTCSCYPEKGADAAVPVLTQLIQFTGSRRLSQCSGFPVPDTGEQAQDGSLSFLHQHSCFNNMKVGQRPIVTQISWQTQVHQDLMETKRLLVRQSQGLFV